MNLLEYLAKIPDRRRKQGIRYPLDKTLTIMLLGTLCGRVGYRSVGRFAKQHKSVLTKLLGLKHGVPSHVSLAAIINGLDYDEFQKVLNEWSLSRLKMTGQGPVVIPIDGKAIKSSVSGGNAEGQNFVTFVSAFCAQQGIVIHAEAGENKHQGELQVVRGVIENLGLTGVVFTLDAAHDSKKP